jgi:hypothetical protein
MQFNTDEINQVAGSLDKLFAPMKEIFECAKRMTNAAGDNQPAVSMNAHFKKIENSFNNTVRESFTNMKGDLSQSAENIEAFNKAMSGITDPNTSMIDNVNQKRHTAAFGAV